MARPASVALCAAPAGVLFLLACAPATPAPGPVASPASASATRPAAVAPAAGSATVTFLARTPGRVVCTDLGPAPAPLAVAAALVALRNATGSVPVAWSGAAAVPHRLSLAPGGYRVLGIGPAAGDQWTFVALVPPLRAGAELALGDVERTGLRLHALALALPAGDAPVFAVRRAEALRPDRAPAPVASVAMSAAGYALLELPVGDAAEFCVGRGTPAPGPAGCQVRIDAAGVLGAHDAVVFVAPQAAARPGTLTVVAAPHQAKWEGNWPEARLLAWRVDGDGFGVEPLAIGTLHTGEQAPKLLLPEGEWELGVLPQASLRVVPETARVVIPGPGWEHELWLEENPPDCTLELGLEPDGSGPPPTAAVTVYARPEAVRWHDQEPWLYLGPARWRTLRETVSRPATPQFLVAAVGQRRWSSRAPVALQAGSQTQELVAATTVQFEVAAAATGPAPALVVGWDGGQATVGLRRAVRWDGGVPRPILRGTLVVPRGLLTVAAAADLTLPGPAPRTLRVAGLFQSAVLP